MVKELELRQVNPPDPVRGLNGIGAVSTQVLASTWVDIEAIWNCGERLPNYASGTHPMSEVNLPASDHNK
jgi:hypothetical protein